MNRLRLNFLLTSIFATLALTGCGSDDDSGGTGPGGPGGFAVTIAAERLEVVADCDDFGGSGAPGDFFIRVELSGTYGNTTTPLGATDYELVQLNAGETEPTLGIFATGNIPARDGYQVTALVSIYENDSGGPQVTATDTMTFEYSISTGCWTYAGDDPCLGRSGSITIGRTLLRDSVGDACDASLYWRFLAQDDL